MGDTPYPPEYFASRRLATRRSAEAMVPVILGLLRPRSVIDVGCGTGVFLAVVREHGVDDVLGVDGPWIERSALEIPPAVFRSADLEAPLALGRTFDLVLSLEVAEHLPEASAATFVSSLTQLGSIVVFSAAIPLQGGEHHVNEQWPAYWVDLFRARGFRGFDPLRQVFWDDDRILCWYAQNALVFAEEERLGRDERLRATLASSPTDILPLVHPALYMAKMRPDAPAPRAGRPAEPGDG